MQETYPGTKSTTEKVVQHLIQTGGFQVHGQHEQIHPAAVLSQFLLFRLRNDILGQTALSSHADTAEALLEDTFPVGAVTRLNGLLSEFPQFQVTRDCVRFADRILRMIEEEQEKEQEKALQQQQSQPQNSDDSSSQSQPGQTDQDEDSTDTDSGDSSQDNPSQGNDFQPIKMLTILLNNRVILNRTMIIKFKALSLNRAMLMFKIQVILMIHNLVRVMLMIPEAITIIHRIRIARHWRKTWLLFCQPAMMMSLMTCLI